MAQIVCIGEGTVRDGICDIWDIVAIHDDDVDLTGGAYDTFHIVKVANLTQQEVTDILALGIPETQDVEVNGAMVTYWLDPISEKWFEKQITPKYPYSLADVTYEEMTTLGDELAGTPEKLAILMKVRVKMTLYAQNLVIEMPEA